jgi:hypothetical protein
MGGPDAAAPPGSGWRRLAPPDVAILACVALSVALASGVSLGILPPSGPVALAFVAPLAVAAVLLVLRRRALRKG